MSTPQQETRPARLTRNLNELLQELRVAQAGVQILFAFLLGITFTEPFVHAGAFVHVLHLTTVLLTTASAALLIAPAAWHRVLFRQGRREEIVRVGNWCAKGGLTLLAAAMTGTVMMTTFIVAGVWVSIGIGVLVAALFLTLWFAMPMHIRRR